VVEVGDYSVELCGGTHVTHTAQVGPIKILGEASIGANLRRIEALTGSEAIAGFRNDRAVLEHIALLVHATPEEAPAKVQRLLDDLKAASQQIAKAQQAGARDQALTLARDAEQMGDATVLVRELPSLRVDELQKLAVAVRDLLGKPAAVVLAGAVDGRGGIVAAVTKDLVGRGVTAKALLADAARAIGGGAGGKDEVATGGGKNGEGVPEAIRLAREAARTALT